MHSVLSLMSFVLPLSTSLVNWQISLRGDFSCKESLCASRCNDVLQLFPLACILFSNQPLSCIGGSAYNTDMFKGFSSCNAFTLLVAGLLGNIPSVNARQSLNCENLSY